MDFDDQIIELNSEIKCTLAPSKIHGIGVFALRDIAKGEKLYCLPPEYHSYDLPYEKFDKLRPEVRTVILERWPSVILGSMFDSPNNVVLMTFMNHSEDPNSDKDVALKDIQKGEEVTEDYRTMPNYEKIFTFL